MQPFSPRGQSPRSNLWRSILAAVSLASSGGATTMAGFVALDSQSRFVLVTTEGYASTPADQVQTLKQTAPDFGPFNGAVSSDDFAQPVEGAFESVSQTSSIMVRPDGLVIQDTAGANTHATGFSGLPSQSYFDVQFTLTAPATFTASYSSVVGSRYGVSAGTPSLFTGPGAPGTLSPPSPLQPGPPTSVMDYSGTLRPGKFEIQANLQDLGGTSSSIDFSVSIRPAAVPLPPAVWATAVMLPLLALAKKWTEGREG